MEKGMNEAILTQEAKDAIRKYMLRLVILPGVFSAILMFMFGYLVKNVAETSAYNDTYRESAAFISKFTEEVLTIKSQAERAKDVIESTSKDARISADKIQRLKDDMEVLRSEIQLIMDSVSSARVFQGTEMFVAAITDNLAKRKDFIENLVREKDESFANLETIVKREKKENFTKLNLLNEIISNLDNRIKQLELAVAIETYGK